MKLAFTSTHVWAFALIKKSFPIFLKHARHSRIPSSLCMISRRQTLDSTLSMHTDSLRRPSKRLHMIWEWLELKFCRSGFKRKSSKLKTCLSRSRSKSTDLTCNKHISSTIFSQRCQHSTPISLSWHLQLTSNLMSTQLLRCPRITTITNLRGWITWWKITKNWSKTRLITADSTRSFKGQ